jgi:hypothetical protein
MASFLTSSFLIKTFAFIVIKAFINQFAKAFGLSLVMVNLKPLTLHSLEDLPMASSLQEIFQHLSHAFPCLNPFYKHRKLELSYFGRVSHPSP